MDLYDQIDLEEKELMNILISGLCSLEHLQEIDLTTCFQGGLLFEKLLEQDNCQKLIENLTSLSINGVENEQFTKILENFINLKSLKIFDNSSIENSMTIKLNDQLEELVINSSVRFKQLNQIMKQGRNLKTLSFVMRPKEIKHLTDMSALENLTSLAINVDQTYSVFVPIDQNNSQTAPIFHSKYFASLKSIRNLTELEIPWTILNENSDSVKKFSQLGQLSLLKRLDLTLLNGDENQIEKSVEKVVETISQLKNLTDLRLDFLEIFSDITEIDQNAFDNIPQLTKLEIFTFVGIPYEDGTHLENLCDHYCVPTLKDLSINLQYGIIPSTNDLKSIQSIEMVIENENNVYYQLFNKTNLSNITSLEIGKVKLQDLQLISQMTNLKNLSMGLGNISSFENVKFPKSLETLALVDCNFLTGLEEEQFLESFENCPFLESIDFTNCPLLQDSFVKQLCNWIENGVDCKKFIFNKCNSLTNDSIFHFKDVKNCKFVHFFECREMYFTKEISNLLIRKDFIAMETAFIVTEHENIDNIDPYIIHEDIANSLEKFESFIRNLLELRQLQKVSLYLIANMFENCSLPSGNEKKLYHVLQDPSTLLETKWFFYYSFLSCDHENTHFKTLPDLHFIYNQAIELIFSQNSQQTKEFIENSKILLVKLFEKGVDDFDTMMNSKSLEYITKYCYEKRYFNILMKCATEEGQLELIEQMTEQDCFQLASLGSHNDFLSLIVHKSPLFRNSPSFTQQMLERGIEIDEIDSELLELNQRVPEQFKNSYLRELTIPMSEKKYDIEGESEPFDAFGYRWNLQIQQDGDSYHFHLVLLSSISLNRKSLDSYENFNGNDGDSIDISFMLLNYDNNPQSYRSARKTFDQSSMKLSFEISTSSIEEFSENSFKVLIGLDLISIKEKIECPFMSPQYSIHNLSFDIPLDLKERYLDEIILYSDPIMIFGTKWTVKFVTKLETGLNEVYLQLASLDLFNEKAVLSGCRVKFYFSNTNLHPDSTIGFERRFIDQKSCYGGPIEHLKISNEDNGMDRYEISLIMNIESISKKHFKSYYQ